MDFLTRLFDTSDFPARWTCGRWTAGHGWLHIVSDLGVWSAYLAIPCVLLFFFLQRKDLPYRKVFLLFGAFILLCGMTHLMEAIIFWWPAYRLAGVLKLLTAIVSWATVFALIPIVPKVLALRSPEELEREIAARKQAEEALQRTNTELELELRVEERSAELKQALVEISNDRELLKTTLESIGDGLITTDAEGRVTNLNPIAEALTGWTTLAAKGQPLTTVFQIINEATREPVLNPVFKALEEGVIVGLANHTLLIHKDGTERPIDDSAAPIRGADLVIQGSVLVFRDITERKRAENALRESEQQLRFHSAILEQVNDVVGAVDTQERSIFLNAAGEQLYGVKASEVIGRPLIELYERRWPSPEYEAEVMATLKETGQAQWEVIHVTRDGRELQVESKVAVFRDNDGKPQGLIAAIRDVTAQKRVAEDLRVSEEFSRSVLESSPDCIKVLDGEGRLQFLNSSGKCLMEIDDFAQFQGQHWWELWPKADQDRVRDAVERAKRGENVAFQAMRPTAKGVLKWWDVVVVPGSGRDAAGRATRLISVSRDITYRKQADEALQASEERYRAATAAVSDLIWTNNADGLMEGEQRGWGEFTGQSCDEYQGYGWSKAVHPEDAQPTIDEWNRAVAEKRVFVFEHRVRRRDGQWRNCAIRAVPILTADGTIREWVGVHTDITDRKRDEEKLRQLAAELSEADHRKNEFLATLAHELRNPLAPIRNGLELMKRVGGQEASIEQVRSMMERQLTQMVRLVDDLLDVSRISRGKLKLRKERVPLATVLNSAVETSRPLIEEMGHELTVTHPEQPLIVDADLTRLAQVFLNLLNNAAKYSERGGHIQLNVERQGSDVVVTVKDTGIGIAADHLPRIFEMFTQVDGTLEKSQGGLGIGLSLVKRLVEMHEGRVEVKSEGPGKGSEFVVRLPLVVEASKPQESGGAAEQPVRSSLRILIVDDNRDGAKTLSMMLKILGNDTRTAYDGQQGVDMAEEYRPDVILLDIGLPKLNGYEACRRIREQPWGKDVVMIAATGWGQDDDRRRSQEAGFDHHLVKPVAPQTLMKILAGLDVGRK